jgi:ribosomal protein S17
MTSSSPFEMNTFGSHLRAEPHRVYRRIVREHGDDDVRIHRLMRSNCDAGSTVECAGCAPAAVPQHELVAGADQARRHLASHLSEA